MFKANRASIIRSINYNSHFVMEGVLGFESELVITNGLTADRPFGHTVNLTIDFFCVI